MKKSILIIALALVAFSCRKKYVCDCRFENAHPAYRNDVWEERPNKAVEPSWGKNCENLGCMWYPKP